MFATSETPEEEKRGRHDNDRLIKRKEPLPLLKKGKYRGGKAVEGVLLPARIMDTGRVSHARRIVHRTEGRSIGGKMKCVALRGRGNRGEMH